ncbi:MFS transporter [Nocardiopsis sp. NPDC049922]|uniref:MFS transporter n=1 Tax=Nocardiopsis sp. NPDC049922 TaxID=3155157 RepID=UPI00340EF667
MNRARPVDTTTRERVGGMTVLLTLVMAWSMLPLFTVAALAPRLGPDLGTGPAELGIAVGAGFAVAAALSPLAGRLTDRWGPRRCTVGLLALAAVGLGLLAVSQELVTLCLALALSGLPQAFANPATNKAILRSVPAERRGGVTGWKQSGVQLGALVAGVPLSLIAAWSGWREAVAVAAVVALLLAVWALLTLAPDAPGGGARGADAEPLPRGLVARLAVFSLFLGVGVSSMNAHVGLFAADELGLAPVAAGLVVAVLGVAGVLGRVLWAARAGQRGAFGLLAPLAGGAVLGPALLVAAAWVPGLVYPAAVAVGGLAVAANAVSMIAVMSAVPGPRAGRATALVSAGFFAGFAVGPGVLGALAETAGYTYAWGWPALALLAAGATAAPWLRKEGRA